MISDTYTKQSIKKNTNRTVNIIAIFCACVLAISSLCVFLPVNGENRIYNDLIRLHVLANSDSEHDQQLKYDLRDYILDDIANITENCANIDEAIEEINGELANIQSKASEFIALKGYDYPLAVTLEQEIYPTREYIGYDGVDFVLPSGKYISLKIEIGNAIGQNWWCVLFPPICLSGTKIEDELAIAGYTNEQINILKKDKDKKYEIRFKFLEILSGLFD
jgi:stage II sporulation protein R